MRNIVPGRLAFFGCICFYFASIGTSAPDCRTWSVKHDGSGDAPTINAAMDSAEAGDLILVGPGDYSKLTEGASAEAMIRLKPGVDLQSEMGPAETVLNGSEEHRVLWGQDVGEVTVSGFAILNGRVNASPPSGAGAYFAGDSNPSFTDCVFQLNEILFMDNSKGGAVFADHATFERVRFLENRLWGIDSEGGAAYVGAAVFTDCVFESNYAAADYDPGGSGHRGGAVYSSAGSYAGCRFVDNRSGGVMSSGPKPGGGAIFDAQTVTISDCEFRQNRAVGDYNSRCGGAVFAHRVIVSGSVFVGNYATGALGGGSVGGAVFADSLVASHSVFLVNEVSQCCPSFEGIGGAIYTAWGDIDHCTFIANANCCAFDDATYSNGILHVQQGIVRNTLVIDTLEGVPCTGNAVWSCSAVYNNPHGNVPCNAAGENFFEEPMFCDTNFIENEDFSLRGDSPYINVEGCGQIGAMGVGCKVTTIEATTWTDLKRRFLKQE